MAANDQQNVRDDEPNHRESAEMATHDDGNRDNPTPVDPTEVARLQKALAEANRKAKADRLENEEFKRQQREAEEAKLGEADRIKRDRELAVAGQRQAEAAAKSAKEELDRFKLDLEIERMALTAGFQYPEAVPRLIDRDLIDFDEDSGKAINLKDVLKRLAEKFPGLLTASPRGGTPPRTGPAPRNGQQDPRGDSVNVVDELRKRVSYPGLGR